MTDQWVTADRCSSSSFVPLFSRPGPGAGAEKIQPQLYLNIYNALSVGSRAAQFGTLGLLLPTIASAAPENRYFIQNANLQLWKTNIGLGWWMRVYIESEIYLR